MVIRWLGHSSFLLISDNGTKIITDPYESGGFNNALRYGPIRISPDIVTVSHEHADHSYTEDLPDDFEVITRPGRKVVKGIEFKGIASFHDNEEGAVRGTNTIFVMTIDHMRVCHLGDLGQVLSESQVEQIGNVDILFIPVGGYYTIGPKDADTVISQLKPKVVFPMHYKTDKVDFPIQPVEDFLHGKENVVRFGTSEIELSQTQLSDHCEIGVLKHAL